MGCSFIVECDHCDTIICSWGDGNETLLADTPWTNVSYTYADTGFYTITLTATRHCLDTIVFRTFHAKLEDGLGIDEFSILNSQFSPYPNPATDMVQVGVSADMELFTLDGRRLRHCHANAMPLDGLAAGVYLLNVAGTTYRIVRN